jgi:hypothetical protein
MTYSCFRSPTRNVLRQTAENSFRYHLWNRTPRFVPVRGFGNCRLIHAGFHASKLPFAADAAEKHRLVIPNDGCCSKRNCLTSGSKASVRTWEAQNYPARVCSDRVNPRCLPRCWLRYHLRIVAPTVTLLPFLQVCFEQQLLREGREVAWRDDGRIQNAGCPVCSRTSAQNCAKLR